MDWALARHRKCSPKTGRRVPRRPLPLLTNAMCQAQRIDLKAARDGKITWAAYFRMWGPN
jgi:hypothetical protein